jgi:hypothetical protein
MPTRIDASWSKMPQIIGKPNTSVSVRTIVNSAHWAYVQTVTPSPVLGEGGV